MRLSKNAGERRIHRSGGSQVGKGERNIIFLSWFKYLNNILRVPRRTTHRDALSGGGQLFITIAMPDPAFGFAMVVFFFEDWIPHDYYSYAENLRGVLVV